MLIFTDGEEQGNRFSFTAPEDGEYYISVANRQIDSVKLDVGGEDRSIDTLKRGYLVETGYVKAGTLILLESNDSAGSMDASAYRFDEAGCVRSMSASTSIHLNWKHWARRR